MQTPSQCSRRPECGGATFCLACVDDGAARADLKLLKSSVKKKSFAEMIQSVWPEAAPAETMVVANHLFKTKRAVVSTTGDGSKMVEHRLWPALRRLKHHAVCVVDPIEYFKSTKEEWALPLLIPSRYSQFNLHVFSQAHTSRVLVRRKTVLNAVDADSLVRSLRAKGIAGTPLETVYREYATAFEDIFKLAAAGKVTIDENMTWHAANVPNATTGALRAWRRALAVYKPRKKQSLKKGQK